MKIITFPNKNTLFEFQTFDRSLHKTAVLGGSISLAGRVDWTGRPVEGLLNLKLDDEKDSCGTICILQRKTGLVTARDPEERMLIESILW